MLVVEDDNVLTKKPIGMKLSNRDILQVLMIIVIMVENHNSSNEIMKRKGA